MHWLILLMVGLVAGAALGLLFFGGLWWTTRRLPASPHAGLLLTVSLLGRMAVLAVGLVILARSSSVLLLGALPGLVAARMTAKHVIVGERLSVATIPVEGPDRGVRDG